MNAPVEDQSVKFVIWKKSEMFNKLGALGGKMEDGVRPA